MEEPDQFGLLSDLRKDIAAKALHAVEQNLARRPSSPVERYKDDRAVEPVVSAMVRLCNLEDFQLAIQLFHRCWKLLTEYERDNQCEVHKSDLVFRASWAYLRTKDFPSAFHYLELLDVEHRRTTGEPAWDQAAYSLIHAIVWNELDLCETRQLTVYQDFWGVPFRRKEAVKDWQSLSAQSRLLYMIINAERLSYEDLTQLPHWPISESFGLAYWNLIADLSRLLETELKVRNVRGADKGLRAMVLQHNSPLPGFSTQVNYLNTHHGVNSPSEFNAQFQTLRTIIADPINRPEERIATAAYLAGVARNQVQHQVDKTMLLFIDRNAAIFTADALLTLCRLDGWV